MAAPLLKCIICPRKPSFSDTPHLLTHLASKTHLSHQFRLHVRSQNDSTAASLLEAFNAWFNDNNFAQALGDRMSSKAKRDTRGRHGKTAPSTTKSALKSAPKSALNSAPKSASKSAPKSAPKSASESVPDTPCLDDPVDANPGAMAPLPNFIDPRLAVPYTAVEEDDEDEEAYPEDVSSLSYSVTPTASGNSNGHPNLQAEVERNSSQSAGNRAFTGPQDQYAPAASVTADIASEPSTPMHARTRMTRNTSFVQLGDDLPDPFVDSQDRMGILDDDDEIEGGRADEPAKLKGVLWPGMDLFDAATEQMRRMRNQKKDGTLLKQMVATSELIEPTEQIFSARGVLLKERVITGNVEDDSPLKGESPIPKKPVRGKRAALRDNDPNQLLGRKRKRINGDVPQSQDKTEEVRDYPEPRVTVYRKAAFGMTFDGDDEGPGVDVRAFKRRPRTGFTVFNGSDGHNRRAPMMDDHRTAWRPSQGTLTPARLLRDHSSNIAYNHGHTIQSPPMGENTGPILNSRGRLDLSSMWNPPLANWQRIDPFSNGYASGRFVDESATASRNMNIVPRSHGYQFNPLLGRSSNAAMFERRPYGEDAITTDGIWVAPHAVSSEGTVAEEDDDDLIQI